MNLLEPIKPWAKDASYSAKAADRDGKALRQGSTNDEHIIFLRIDYIRVG